MIRDIDFSKKNKIELLLSNGEKVTINLLLLDPDYEVHLTKTLKQYTKT